MRRSVYFILLGIVTCFFFMAGTRAVSAQEKSSLDIMAQQNEIQQEIYHLENKVQEVEKRMKEVENEGPRDFQYQKLEALRDGLNMSIEGLKKKLKKSEIKN